MWQLREAAFDEGLGRVIIWGADYPQYCNSDETFYELELNKIFGSSFCIDGYDVTCAAYDWTIGGMNIISGSFTANDLVDDGIYGDITVNNGALLSLTQGADDFEYVDLNGNLTIDGGEVHLYGGSDNSYWTWNGDASITMTNDAGLYFEDVGIHIVVKEPFTFSENISGGEIHTASNFIVERDNFTPTSSHIYMDGSQDALLSVVTGSHLSSLDINKSAKKGSQQHYKKSPRK